MMRNVKFIWTEDGQERSRMIRKRIIERDGKFYVKHDQQFMPVSDDAYEWAVRMGPLLISMMRDVRVDWTDKGTIVHSQMLSKRVVKHDGVWYMIFRNHRVALREVPGSTLLVVQLRKY